MLFLCKREEKFRKYTYNYYSSAHKETQDKIETNNIGENNKRNSRKLHHSLYNPDLWNHVNASSYTQENKDGQKLKWNTNRNKQMNQLGDGGEN